MLDEAILKWNAGLQESMLGIQITDDNGKIIEKKDAFKKIYSHLNNKIFFIGNGGSAAIASHMAIDYTKNGKMKAMAFNDAAALTCISNDMKYEYVFSEQVITWCDKGDILFCISSSGCSINIMAAQAMAKNKYVFVVTLSAFDQNNPLRKTGHINFYVPTREYGFAEITHLSILHSILDLRNER